MPYRHICSYVNRFLKKIRCGIKYGSDGGLKNQSICEHALNEPTSEAFLPPYVHHLSCIIYQRLQTLFSLKHEMHLIWHFVMEELYNTDHKIQPIL